MYKLTRMFASGKIAPSEYRNVQRSNYKANVRRQSGEPMVLIISHNFKIVIIPIFS